MVCLHIITGSLNQSRFSILNENLNTIHVHDKLISFLIETHFTFVYKISSFWRFRRLIQTLK